MANKTSSLELCGKCWWMTTDPYTLASNLLLRGYPEYLVYENIADELRELQREETQVWFRKKTRRCRLCSSRTPTHKTSESQYMRWDLSKANLLANPEGYRGDVRFTVTSDSVVIDQGYVKNRLASPTGMTKWEGPEQIVKQCQISPNRLNILRRTDDVIQFIVYNSTNCKSLISILTQT